MDPSAYRSQTLDRFSDWRLAPNLHLPLLESMAERRPKTAAEVASRAVAAGHVAAACFGAPASKVLSTLERSGLLPFISPEESAFLADPDEQSAAFHGWLIESIQFLGWALGHVVLDHFAACQDTLASHFPAPGTDPAPFISASTLRPASEIELEADTLYMLHWRAVENNITGRSDDRILLPMVSFRRHAADWVIGVADAWEDVPLDT
jgi:hypothetical protein